MADITLAEFNGGTWMVSGEAYIDDLLANTLPADVSIEMVQCESQTEVRDLWVQHCGAQTTLGMPWMIHPNIAVRIRRSSPDYAVFFAQWSALLDPDALAVIQAAARLAQENPELPVRLVAFLDPAGPQAITDLSRLRAQLIEDRLAGHGVERTRIARSHRDVAEMAGMSQESQRIDIIVRAG